MAHLGDSIWRKEMSTESFVRLASAFWYWYSAEAQTLLPPTTISWLLNRGERKLIIRAQAGGDVVSMFGDEATPAGGDGGMNNPAPSAHELLMRHSKANKATKLILELPREKFFVRSFEAPAAARAALAQLLPSEIERKTLFKLDDIFFGHVVGKSLEHPGKLRVTQWILRRDMAQSALEQAGLTLADLDMVRPTPGSDGDNELPQIAVKPSAKSSTWFRQTLMAMGVLGVCLFIAAATLKTLSVHKTGAQLDEEIAAAARQAGVVRTLARQATAESALLSGMRRERDDTPSLADLLEETARILPDSAYLREWRLSEQKPGERRVDLTGIADAAADLPALLDKSPMFFDTTLTTAITPDAQEKRERFSLQTRVIVKNRTSRQ